jgi:uncharacterized membrane protein
MSRIKVLFAGESWFYTTIETKGFDQFTIGGYQTEIGRIRNIMKDYAEITHLPAHLVLTQFPDTMEELKQYDAILVSDVGANTFLLHPDTFNQSIPTPNRLRLIAEYVKQGGAFGMIGGYMSFTGIEGKAAYRRTPIEEILPVTMLSGDDREEHPEGLRLQIDPESHPVLKGLPEQWPPLLGYNKVIAKQDAEVAVTYQGDPILSFASCGKGKTFAWAGDCAPHWMPPEFCESDCNRRLWENILNYIIK